MIDELRRIARRPVRELPTRLVPAACALLIVLGAVLLSRLGEPEPEQRPAPRTSDGTLPAGDYEVTNPPVVSHDEHPSELPSEEGPNRARVTPHDGRDIRSSTRRFMLGYLAYSYGRGAPADITNATRELIAELEQQPPRVPDRLARRHPQVELVHLDGAGPERAAAIALVDDGLARYSVSVRLIRTGAEEWSVTDVGPA
jgi:hypothetical protein